MAVVSVKQKSKEDGQHRSLRTVVGGTEITVRYLRLRHRHHRRLGQLGYRL